MLPLSVYTSLDPKLRKIFDEISYRAINGRLQPLIVDEAHSKVGINTDTPTKELDVNGSIQALAAYLTVLSVLGNAAIQNLDVPGSLSSSVFSAATKAKLNNTELYGTI